MFRSVFLIFVFTVIFSSSAFASCTNPAGEEGEMMYNTTWKTVQFCDGTDWWDTKGAGQIPTCGVVGSILVWNGSTWTCSLDTAISCKSILENGDSTGDGIYSIDVDGTGGLDPFDVYCDMTTDGGGWTLVGTIANDNNDYWTWDNLFIAGYARNGSQYGAVSTNTDHQSAAWHLVSGNSMMFTDLNNDASTYAVYNGILSNQTIASKYPAVETAIGEFTASTIEGTWWQECGTELHMSLMEKDSDGGGWGVGFIWRSTGNNPCNYDDLLGGINKQDQIPTTAEAWDETPGSGLLFDFYNNNFPIALNVFVR